MTKAQADKAPAYQWYPKDYETDEAVKLMSYEQEGVYRRLLDHQWLHGSIPADPRQIAALLPKVPRARFLKLWPGIEAKFCATTDGRLANRRIERARQEAAEYKQIKSEAGQRGADARWGRQTDAGAIDLPLAKNGSASATATASPPASASASVLPHPKGTDHPSSRSRRPVYRGTRFVVFDWQLDDIGRLLGQKTLDAFEIDVFFDELNRRVDAENLVVPQRDGGQWLQAQVLAEAQRRGLPVASTETPTLGKLSSRMAAMVTNARRPV